MDSGKEYHLHQEIGAGTFGVVYRGSNIISGEEVAIKLESVMARNPLLAREVQIYKALAGGVGVPSVKWFGLMSLEFPFRRSDFPSSSSFRRRTPSPPSYWPSTPSYAPSCPSYWPSTPSYAPSCPSYWPSTPSYAPSCPSSEQEPYLTYGYNAMAIDLLGPNLEDMFNSCGRKFTLKTTLLLADQMISRVEYVHRCGFIHRDIKPDNLCMGVGKLRNTVHIVDFGLAKEYISPGTDIHIRYKEGKGLIGTARYASINAHLGVEQARRDDLESLGYVFMYFLRGNLPWQGIDATGVTGKQWRYDIIRERKEDTRLDPNFFRGFPKEFAEYLNYTKSLKFTEKPDYSYLRMLFVDVFFREGFHFDIFESSLLKLGAPDQGSAAVEEAGQIPDSEPRGIGSIEVSSDYEQSEASQDNGFNSRDVGNPCTPYCLPSPLYSVTQISWNSSLF